MDNKQLTAEEKKAMIKALVKCTSVSASYDHFGLSDTPGLNAWITDNSAEHTANKIIDLLCSAPLEGEAETHPYNLPPGTYFRGNMEYTVEPTTEEEKQNYIARLQFFLNPESGK